MSQIESDSSKISISKFVTKYIFRTLHMATYGFIFGNLVFDFLFGRRNIKITDKNYYKFFHIFSCVVLMVAGVINMIILIKENNYVRNFYYEIWKKSLIFKVFLTLGLTPILEKLTPSYLIPRSDNALYFLKIRLVIATVLFFLSPFLRYWRESFLTSQKSQLPAGAKVNSN
jgi:hypothetical protein